jgi:hypothetical protein
MTEPAEGKPQHDQESDKQGKRRITVDLDGLAQFLVFHANWEKGDPKKENPAYRLSHLRVGGLNPDNPMALRNAMAAIFSPDYRLMGRFQSSEDYEYAYAEPEALRRLQREYRQSHSGERGAAIDSYGSFGRGR